MESRKLQPISTFIETLEQLCSQGLSGVLYFVSPDEHAGHIMVHEGEIIVLRYYTQRGISVVDALRSWTQLSYRFIAKGVTLQRDDSLPDTDEILNRLSLDLLMQFSAEELLA